MVVVPPYRLVNLRCLRSAWLSAMGGGRRWTDVARGVMLEFSCAAVYIGIDVRWRSSVAMGVDRPAMYS